MSIEKEKEIAYQQQLAADYRQWLEPYFRYIPWFEERKGRKQARMYDGENTSATIAVPVYDSTLLNFVRGMQDTGLMNRNYPYIYSKYGLRTFSDELFRIEQCKLKNIDIIIGIISKYVLGGMTKGKLWTDAVEEGIFYHALVRIKELLDIFDSRG